MDRRAAEMRQIRSRIYRQQLCGSSSRRPASRRVRAALTACAVAANLCMRRFEVQLAGALKMQLKRRLPCVVGCFFASGTGPSAPASVSFLISAHDSRLTGAACRFQVSTSF
jgi:hypothetical protein